MDGWMSIKDILLGPAGTTTTMRAADIMHTR